MKKLVIFAIIMAMLLTACGRNTVAVGVENTPAEVRTIACTLCHSEGVCYHCDGDAFRNGRRCSVCNGSGGCNKCNGSGELEVLEINGKDFTRCSSCGTSGICPMCDGSGDMENYGGARANCMICRGSGVCIGCKGSGLLPLRGF